VEPLASGIAARTFDNPPVTTPAAPAEITPKNALRFIAHKIRRPYERSTIQLSIDFESDDFSSIFEEERS
jgi:hypothetical protein